MQLSCGHVDIDRMIIHDDNPNQGFLSFFIWGGWGGEKGQAGVQGKEVVSGEFRTIILNSYK